jgi:hypothetical protein
VTEVEPIAPAWDDACAAVTPAKIQHGALKQHMVRTLDDGLVQLVAAALGQPRLWEYLLRGALDGFDDGYGRPHDGRMSTRLHQGALVAQQSLRRKVDGLIERRPSDVALLAIAREGDVLHVLTVGPLEAHLYQQGALRKVSPAEALTDGLLKLSPHWSTERLYPGDLIIGGSTSACASPALASLSHLFATGVAVRSRDVVEQLQRRAVDQGMPSAVVVLKAPLS